MCCSDNQQVVQNELPSWLEDHYKQRVQQKQGLYDLGKDIYQQTKDYTPYPGERIQPLTSDQLTAQEMVRRNVGLQDDPPVGARGVQAAQESMADARQRYGERFQPPMVNQENYEQAFNPATYEAAQAPGTRYNAATIDAAQEDISDLRDVQTQRFDGQAANQYMNPYREQVADVVAGEMRRDEQREQLRNEQAATAAGAFGGSRHAIVDAERERNFQDQLGDQMTEIMDRGYRQARSQFNQDRGRSLEGQQFNVGTELDRQAQNQQSGLRGLLANQSAANTARQFGADQQMRSNLANQQARNQARQYAANTQNDAFLVNRDTFNQNQQRQLQAQQFNANMGLQGFNANRGQYNTEQDRLMQAGQGLAGLGQQQQNMAQQNVNSLQSVGAQSQQMGQKANNIQYQDFLNQRSWPYQQYSFLSGAIQGQPVDANAFRRQTTQGGGPGALQTVAGLGATTIGAAGAAGGFGDLFGA